MTESPLLTARGVSVTLAGRLVLSDVSLSLAAGHLVALVGPNGAGKTTLLRALSGLLPSDGAIHIGGDDLANLSLRERAKRFAYLPQGHVVHWPLPARDIVALGRYPHGGNGEQGADRAARGLTGRVAHHLFRCWRHRLQP
jgi:iron complex transport system ATP-binding protein